MINTPCTLYVTIAVPGFPLDTMSRDANMRIRDGRFDL